VRAAAAEYQNTGVTINAICPGYVDTPMIDKNVEKIVRQTGRSAEEVRANMASGQGRLLTSQEVSDAVMDLINSELTGASPVLPEGMV
jgi:NAD(P)-dependent dehydrogenase (short-subunit alcohol dehydrogenase family)